MKKPPILDQLRHQVEREDELSSLLNHLRGLHQLSSGLVQAYGQSVEEETAEAVRSEESDIVADDGEEVESRPLSAEQMVARQGVLLRDSIVRAVSSLAESPAPLLAKRVGQEVESLGVLVESTSLLVTSLQAPGVRLGDLQVEGELKDATWPSSLVPPTAPVEVQLNSYAAALRRSANYYLHSEEEWAQLSPWAQEQITALKRELEQKQEELRRLEEEKKTWSQLPYPVLLEYDMAFFAARTGFSRYYVSQLVEPYERNSNHQKFSTKKDRTRKVFTADAWHAQHFEKWICKHHKCPNK